MVLVADKYDLPGLLKLFCRKIRHKVLSGETVADLLIAAHRHVKKNVREVALEKIENNKNICKKEGFKVKMRMADPTIMLDVFNDSDSECRFSLLR